MQHPGFFHRAGPFALRTIAEAVGAERIGDAEGDREIDDLRPLQDAGPSHLTFLDNRKYAVHLPSTRAAACLLTRRDIGRTPSGTVAVATAAPYRAFARALALFYADAFHPKVAGPAADPAGRLIHPTAEIDSSVTLGPGAIVGKEARISAGTTVSAGAVVGYRVRIGSDGYIGPGAVVTHALIGDRVIVHAGGRIGQDGFGFAMGRQGHLKVPQIGRVIIGDDVEIGANSTVDRGSLADTVIGEGTKIDNLVQIAHNVIVGRHCLIAAQSGIAGSSELGDFVVMGAKSGVLGHLRVGSGAQIAGMAHVKDDVEAGARMDGTPARPFKEWARGVAVLRQLARKGI
jgi:UDP-3-O-[3-hydroxymyristoyl] glucosamine N-acyltransferase